MSRALFSGSASPRAHCLRPRRARRDAAAAAAQCALQCMLAVKQRRRLTERVLSVLNVRGPSTGRVGRLSGCQARAALAHTPSIFRWSFFFYYSYTSLFTTFSAVTANRPPQSVQEVSISNQLFNDSGSHNVGREGGPRRGAPLARCLLRPR